jgi:isoleucyl-tRNA synthetase
MGVHHCWGRTLKDVFQRYKALQGFDQRYQNGFDCQGLWVEVDVERELGLNSKREIEEYGLAQFARSAASRSPSTSEVITEQSKRLGMWMDWDNDYYTFSDTNIEYIWRFLKTCTSAAGCTWAPLERVVPALRDVASPSTS